MSSNLDRLEQLARLRDAGVLTQEEFTHQKQLILAASTSSPEPVPAQSSSAAPEDVAAAEAALDREVYFNPFKPVESPLVAGVLVKLSAAAAVTVLIDEAIRFGLDVYWSGTAALYPNLSNETVIAVSFAEMVFWSGVAALLARHIIKARSRWASLALLALTALGVAGHILAIVETGSFKNYYVFAGLPLLLAYQAVRGIYAERRLQQALS